MNTVSFRYSILKQTAHFTQKVVFTKSHYKRFASTYILYRKTLQDSEIIARKGMTCYEMLSRATVTWAVSKAVLNIRFPRCGFLNGLRKLRELKGKIGKEVFRYILVRSVLNTYC
jgi:hypothetical protein